MELSVIAKPYAKAISDIAIADGSYDSWRLLLQTLAIIISDDATKDFIKAPQISSEDKFSFVTATLNNALGRGLDEKESNFIKLLVDNNRLFASSSIAELFVNITASNTKNIKVISAYELDPAEIDEITKALTNKYKSEVSLSTVVDSSLSAGVIIKDGDKVIDVSIKARLRGLSASLSII